MNLQDLIAKADEFEWDEGNTDKNWDSHRVRNEEAEEVFSNEPKLLSEDKKHSEKEPRYFCLGQTYKGRTMLVSFTLRRDHIRIISARDMSRKERKIYEKIIKTNS